MSCRSPAAPPGFPSTTCTPPSGHAPALQRLVLAYNEALLAQAYHTVACNAVHPVEARCCRWLLSTHDRLDQDALPLTHEFLAEMLGVQRSTVSATLRGLQDHRR